MMVEPIQHLLLDDDKTCIRISLIEATSPDLPTEESYNITGDENSQADPSTESSLNNNSKTQKNGNSPTSRYRSHMPTLNIVSRLTDNTGLKFEMDDIEQKLTATPEQRFRQGKSFVGFQANKQVTSKDSSKTLSKRDLFKQKLQSSSSHLVVNVINTSNSKSSRQSFSSVSVSSSQMNSPCLPSSVRIVSLNNDEENRKFESHPTFEERFEMLDTILGQGCSSVVKLCQLRTPISPKNNIEDSIQNLSDQLEQPELDRIYSENDINQRRDSYYKSSTHVDRVSDELISSQKRKTLLTKNLTNVQLKEVDEFSSEDENIYKDLSPIQITLNIPSHNHYTAKKSQFSNGFKAACAARKQERKEKNVNDQEEEKQVSSEQKNLNKFAVKVIRNRDEEYQQIAIKEFYLLQTLNHPNIVKMTEAYYNKQRETLYFVMDFVEGYTLKNYIKLYKLKHRDQKGAGGLPEDICKIILVKIVNVIKYLHSDKISVCHRDLNPGNIIINHENFENEPRVTIIDFNVARRFKDLETQQKLLMMTNTGAAAFSSPEIQKGSSYNEVIDIWGTGCAFYLMLFGQIPFPQKDQQQLSDAIINGEYTRNDTRWSLVSDSALDLLQGMLCIDPEQRLSIDQVIGHPWLNEQYLQSFQNI